MMNSYNKPFALSRLYTFLHFYKSYFPYDRQIGSHPIQDQNV